MNDPRKPRKSSYDEQCEYLADYFMSAHQNRLRFGWAETQSLAQAIQDAVEAWFADQPELPASTDIMSLTDGG